MALSFADLFTATTKNQATQAILDVGTALGFNVTAWQSGRAGRVLISMVATIYSGFTVIAVSVAQSGFRETAIGDWLTLVSKQVYDVDKNVQTYATGFETLTSTAAVPYTFSPQGLTLTNGATGASYTNTYDVALYGALPGLATLPASGTLTIPVQALVPGSASNATPGQIDTLNPSFLGVTVSNALPVLGNDDETDDALRARDLTKLGSLSPDGHAGAYLYWALSVRKDGSGNAVYPPPVGEQAAYDAATALAVVRAKVVQNSTTGALTLYLANAAATASGGDVTLIDVAVQTFVVPAAVTETTLAASTVSVSITYSAELDPAYGVSSATAQSTIEAAIVAWFKDVRKNPIGAKSKVPAGQAYVFVKVLESVIVNALPAAGLPPAIIDADVTVPAADVAVSPSQLAVYSGPATATINVVPQ